MNKLESVKDIATAILAESKAKYSYGNDYYLAKWIDSWNEEAIQAVV